MKKFILFSLILIGSSAFAQQIDISAEIRPRFEFRNGYGTLMPDNQNPASFVSQRTRLNLTFQNDKLKLYTSLQNVSIWGDVTTLSQTSRNGIVFHEAWGEIKATPTISFKLGRQEISYDDERIFGSVGWAQQARSHDALLVKFEPSDKHQIHLGLAINATAETLFDVPYIVNQYRNMEYALYRVTLNSLQLSLLAMNLGVPYIKDSIQETAYNQTLGARLAYANNKIKTVGAFYIQTGKLASIDLSALYASANISYDFTKSFNAGAGFEFLSGTDQNSNSKTLKSFNPWFGTNHKFNGTMDYFYVANHINSVGLNDLYAHAKFNKDAISIVLSPHVFTAPSIIISPEGKNLSAYLGTELDFVAGYQINEYANLKVGYSQMFATESMEALKSGNADNANNWAWVMITINPTLFSSNKNIPKKEL